MGSTLSVIKTLIVPAVISLILFLLLNLVLIPLWRRYRAYSQYLPLASISSRTSSLRNRLGSRMVNLVPARWRAHTSSVFSGAPASDDGFDDEGEELSDVDEQTFRAIEREARAARPDNTRRLSRDLEEGFRDDSDDEPDRIVQSVRIRS